MRTADLQYSCGNCEISFCREMQSFPLPCQAEHWKAVMEIQSAIYCRLICSDMPVAKLVPAFTKRNSVRTCRKLGYLYWEYIGMPCPWRSLRHGWRGSWTAWCGTWSRCWQPCLWQRGWNLIILEVPTNPRHSMIICVNGISLFSVQVDWAQINRNTC